MAGTISWPVGTWMLKLPAVQPALTSEAVTVTLTEAGRMNPVVVGVVALNVVWLISVNPVMVTDVLDVPFKVPKVAHCAGTLAELFQMRTSATEALVPNPSVAAAMVWFAWAELE